MNLLLTIREEEIYSDTPKYKVNDSWDNRLAVKVIVFDEYNKIALVSIRGFLLPGGGVEKEESLEEAVLRECLEEVGCGVKIVEEVGMIKDFRTKTRRKQETHCFIARVVGEKGSPQTTQEDEQGMKVVSLPRTILGRLAELGVPIIL